MPASSRQRSTPLPIALMLATVLALLATACESKSRQPIRYPPTQPAPAGQAAPARTAPRAQPPPAQTQPAPGATASPPATAAAPYPAASDPINNVDLAWLRNRAQAVLRELVAALDPGPRSRVQGIPLVVDEADDEVNAFAACTSSGKAAMAITDGLLGVMAHLARYQAVDEVFGTSKADEYIRFIATSQQPGQPIVQPAPGFVTAAQQADGRKLQRQHQLLDEQLAFVLGHELAHHYLGHLPCTAASAVLTASEINTLLSSAVPAFNQPNEIAADVNGVNSVLNAGKRRQGYPWTEGGALLSMRFFGGLDRFSASDIIFGIDRSHPPPAVRQPIVEQTARTWRAMGGRSIPVP